MRPPQYRTYRPSAAEDVPPSPALERRENETREEYQRRLVLGCAGLIGLLEQYEKRAVIERSEELLPYYKKADGKGSDEVIQGLTRLISQFYAHLRFYEAQFPSVFRKTEIRRRKRQLEKILSPKGSLSLPVREGDDGIQQGRRQSSFQGVPSADLGRRASEGLEPYVRRLYQHTAGVIGLLEQYEKEATRERFTELHTLSKRVDQQPSEALAKQFLALLQRLYARFDEYQAAYPHYAQKKIIHARRRKLEKLLAS